MQRNAIIDLNDWFYRKNRKPLILRGARQVGKSTLVRLAAKQMDLDLFEVNLERHIRLNSVFATLDTDKIIDAINSVLRRRLPEKGRAERALLFLDEIQATPQAIPALRYFLEERPDLAVVAAGSLLEFTLVSHEFSMPVGRIEYLHLGPLTFEEYLRARSEDWLLERLANYHLGDAWSDIDAERARAKFREFLFVGGMPEPLNDYISEGSSGASWSRAQRRVLDTYKDDFPKYTRRSALGPVLQGVFERLPATVGRKTKLSDLMPGTRAEYVRNAVELLHNARVVHRAFHTHATGIPLGAEMDRRVSKSFWLDCGLLNRALDLELEHAPSDDPMIHEGPLAEQFVAQHLAYWSGNAVSPALFYWLREGQSANAEVDFLLQVGQEIIPVEVKSRKSGALKSMLHFVAERDSRLAVKFSLEHPSIHAIRHRATVGTEVVAVGFQLLTLPLYMIGQAPRLVREALSYQP